jgi:DNA-binding transcriptional MerR regulator
MNNNENLGEGMPGKNMDIELTVKEAANIIDETSNVLRNWFKELRDYIPHEKNKSGYNVFNQKSIERLREIKSLHRDQNWSMKQIEHYYATGGEAFKPEPEKTTGEVIAEELRALREEMRHLREDNQYLKEAHDKQKEFNQVLVKKLDEQDQRTKEYYARFDENIRLMQDTKKLLAATKEDQGENHSNNMDKPDKKGFFMRLFNR